MDTDEEQVEKLKAWLKENGLSIVFGIVIGVGGIGGYNYWQQYQETRAAEASGYFSRVIEALEQGDEENLRLQADSLLEEYADSDYALMARLALARHHVDKGEFEQAAQMLQQAAGVGAQRPLAYVAMTRLAAVQIELQQYENALQTLSAQFPDEFAARVDELRGDAFAMQGKVDEAAEAYRKAQSAQLKPANPEFLQQKIDDLGVNS